MGFFFSLLIVCSASISLPLFCSKNGIVSVACLAVIIIVQMPNVNSPKPFKIEVVKSPSVWKNPNT